MVFGFSSFVVTGILVLSLFALSSRQNFKGRELLYAFISTQLVILVLDLLSSYYMHFPPISALDTLLLNLQKAKPVMYIVVWIIFYRYIGTLADTEKEPVTIRKEKYSDKNKYSDNRRSTKLPKYENQRVRIDNPRSDTPKWIALILTLITLSFLYLLYTSQKGSPV